MDSQLSQAYKDYCKRHSVTVMEHKEQGLIDRTYLAAIIISDTQDYKNALLSAMIKTEIQSLDMDLNDEDRADRLRKTAADFRTIENSKPKQIKEVEKVSDRTPISKDKNMTVVNGYRFHKLDMELVAKCQTLVDAGTRLTTIAKKLGKEYQVIKAWISAKLVKVPLNLGRDKARMTKDMIKEIQKRLDKFERIKDISLDLNVDQKRISQLVNRGILTKPDPKIEILLRFQRGQSLEQVADFFGISVLSLQHKCYNLGIIPSKEIKPKPIQTKTEKKLEQLKQLMDKGMRKYAAARELGIANHVVFKLTKIGLL